MNMMTETVIMFYLTTQVKLVRSISVHGSLISYDLNKFTSGYVSLIIFNMMIYNIKVNKKLHVDIKRSIKQA